MACGFGYTAFVVDAYAALIAGWECSLRKDTGFVERALRHAAAYRARQGHPLDDAIHHSDAGSHYAAMHYSEILMLEGLIPSVGTVGDALDKGVDYIHNQVVAMDRVGDRVAAIHLGTGETITAGVVVDAAGTRAAQVARMAGVDLPIEARRRYTYIFSVDTPLDQDLPLTIDPTGVHMRSYGAHDYLVGCPPIGPDTAVDVDDFTYPENVWEDKMLPVLANRVPQFGTAKVTESWMGHYEFNSFDHNAILGAHAEVPNLLMCNGFSGHGSPSRHRRADAVSLN